MIRFRGLLLYVGVSQMLKAAGDLHSGVTGPGQETGDETVQLLPRNVTSNTQDDLDWIDLATSSAGQVLWKSPHKDW